MRYRLRTLLIVVALGPPVLAGAWAFTTKYTAWRNRRENERFTQELLKALSEMGPCQPYPGDGS
jgi:hypothetical protein